MNLYNFLNYSNLPTTNREMGTAPNKMKTIPEHITKNTNVTNTKIICQFLTRSNADTTKFEDHTGRIIWLLFGHSNIILNLSHYVIIRWWRSSCTQNLRLNKVLRLLNVSRNWNAHWTYNIILTLTDIFLLYRWVLRWRGWRQGWWFILRRNVL